MANPNPSLFLGNVQCKNNDVWSIFHNATVTVNLFEFLQKLVGIYLKNGKRCFPQFGYG